MKKYLMLVVCLLFLSVNVYAIDNNKASITVLTKEVDKGEKVYLELDETDYSNCDLTVTLENQDEGENVTAKVESISSNPYFVMPVTVKEGTTFKLKVFKSVNRILGDVDLDGKRTDNDLDLLQKYLAEWENILTTEEQLKRADVNLDGEIKMSDLTKLQQDLAGWEVAPITIKYDNTASANTVRIKIKDTSVYDNDDVNSDIINQIKSSENKIIQLIIGEKKKVDLEVFRAIKGTDKTLIIKYGQVEYEFNGKDIVNLVDFNVDVLFYKSEVDEQINKMLKNGLVVDLTNNRTIPSEFIIRIDNSKFKEYESDVDEVSVQSVTDNKSDLYLSSLKLNNNKYEFNVKKPVKYVMVKIDKTENVTVEDTGASKNTTKIIVSIAILATVILGYIYSIINKSRKNNII